jgi:hypothetical protein
MDGDLARLAARQHGVVSRAQLAGLGLGPRGVDRRVEAGRLHRLHPGVYAVGHRRLDRLGVWTAAVLACGEGALLSHRSAAALWGLRPADRTRIDVTTTSTRSFAARGIDLHRTRTLRHHERAEHDGVPVTTPARTLVDLAAVLPAAALARAVHEAEVLRILDVAAVEAAMGPGRRGVATLRRLLAVPDAGIRRHELEHRFHDLCRTAGLPMPRCNFHVRAGDRLVELDAFWPEPGLAVELDGAATHLTHRAFEEDRRRDAALLRIGIPVVRVTWQRLTTERAELVDDLRALLGQV